MAYATKQSSAYKLKPQPKQQPETTPVRAARPKMELVPETAKRRRQAVAPVGKYAVMMLCVMLAALTIIYGNMRLNELTSQNDRLKGQLADLQSQGSILDTKKDQKYNLNYVEQRAKSDLGMVKLDKSAIQYVEIPNPESTLVTPGTSVTSELLSSVGESLSIVVEYLN